MYLGGDELATGGELLASCVEERSLERNENFVRIPGGVAASSDGEQNPSGKEPADSGKRRQPTPEIESVSVLRNE